MKDDKKNKLSSFLLVVKDFIYSSFGEETDPATAFAVAAVLIGLAMGYYGRFVSRRSAAINLMKLMEKYKNEPEPSSKSMN